LKLELGSNDLELENTQAKIQIEITIMSLL